MKGPSVMDASHVETSGPAPREGLGGFFVVVLLVFLAQAFASLPLALEDVVVLLPSLVMSLSANLTGLAVVYHRERRLSSAAAARAFSHRAVTFLLFVLTQLATFFLLAVLALPFKDLYYVHPLYLAQQRSFWLSLVHIIPFAFATVFLVCYAHFTSQRALANARLAEEQRLSRVRSDALRTATELQMVRTYMQPHFLFNTLNGIASLIDVAPQQARNAVVATSELLRSALSLESHDGDLIAVRDELVVVRHYLALEQLRMEQRLVVSEVIDPEVLHSLIPRFLLQTLVENAVRHGLFPKPGGGTLHLSLQKTERGLEVRVSDTGVGASVETVEVSTGFGLRALRGRLHSLYEGQASFHIHTAPNEGFVATVSLPWDVSEPGGN